MTSSAWKLVELAGSLLEPDEREAVLGDLLETERTGSEGLGDVLGLVVRRQILPWKDWRPWFTVFGLALPASLLLMGLSVSSSSICEHLLDHRILMTSQHFIQKALFELLCRSLLLIGGAWACGFVMGSISRRTLWLSIASACFPCLFCLVRFREPSLSRFCLFLFILPAIWGVRSALRLPRLSLALALFLAFAVTVLTILPVNSRGVWALNWSLVWPAWYIVASARQKKGELIKIGTTDALRGVQE